MPTPDEDVVEFVLSNMIELARQQHDQRIQPTQVRTWAGGAVNDRFFNLIGLRVAEYYADNSIGYDVADAIINDLWYAWLDGIATHDGEVPNQFYDIYLAFDAGEGLRSTDKDPVKEFTDPWIADILARRRGQSK